MKLTMLMMFVVGLATGCKQGLHERCQVTSDCEDGLVCNQATQSCEATTGTGIDAMLPVDAKPIDAMIDAP